MSAGLILFLWVTSGCAPGETAVLHRRLGVDWSRGTQWGVKVRVWPGRFGDAHAENVSPEEMTWRYRVARVDPETGRYTVVQSNGSVAGRLLFSRDFNLLEVGVFRGRADGEALQVQSVLTNSLGGRAMIQRAPVRQLPVLWFHPDMTVRDLDGSTRMNFDPGPGDWITQTVRTSTEEDGVNIRLYHRPTRVAVTFDWRRGEPWWHRVVWERRRRVVGVAERVRPPAFSGRTPDTPPLRTP